MRAVNVGDDAANAGRQSSLYSWSFIAELSAASKQPNTSSSCVAVSVATVTSFNPPRSCIVPTSGPSCTSVCSRQPSGLPARNRIIRIDLTALPTSSSSSPAAAAAAASRAALNQHHDHDHQHGKCFEKVFVSTRLAPKKNL